MGTLYPTSPCGHRQLRWGLLGARTSPVAPRTPRCSDIAAYTGDSSLLGAQTSPATSGNSSLLGARTSPVTLGTPRSSVLGHRQQRRGLPCCSDLATSRQCAIKLLHVVRIRVLILGSTSMVFIRTCWMTLTKILDFFFFDPAIRFILHLPAGSRTKWAHFTLR